MKKFVRCLVISLAAAALAGTAHANLLKNYGFESALSTQDWSATWGNQQFARETWNSPPEGSWAIYFKGTWSGGDNYGGGLQVVTGITAGLTYNLSASFYWDNGWSSSYQAMKLEFFDSSFNLLAAYTNYLQGLPEATWAVRSITNVVAPVGSALAQVVFEGNGFGSAGVLAGDNFVFEAQTIPEPTTAMLGLLGVGVVVCLRRLRR
jgi:hypothetical protein